MSDDERIARLEQRLQVLEGLVRQLVAQGRSSAELAAARPVVTQTAQTPAPPVRRPDPVPAPPTPAASPRAGGLLGAEQWLGQRGLLAVGVIFVILAAGYLLKLTFDRGWVSPFVRCLGGTIVGFGVGTLGWWLHNRGTRIYGAALIGCGAAIMYLAVWAAARLYEFLPPTSAVAALALVSIGLAAVAFAIDVEALGATAALGAFFAPIVVGREAGTANLLLLYLGAMGAGLGWISARRRWRIATFVVALAYFGVASSGVLRQADPTGLYLYGILGGAAGLFVGLREGWFETRLLAFTGGWAVLWLANEAAAHHGATLLGGMILTAPVWWRAFTAGTVWPGAPRRTAPRLAFGDSFYFFLSPVLLGFALHEVMPQRLNDIRGLVPLLIALPYVVVGLSRPAWRPFALVGAAGLVVAILTHWTGVESTWALLALAHLWALSDHLLKRSDGGWYALGTATVALVHLLGTDLPARPVDEPAFIGAWALSLWLAIETLSALAAGLLRDRGPLEGVDFRPIPILWGVAGLLLLFGVTGEIMRYFDLSQLERGTARLASGLSVSAWWICCAAACFFVGFKRRARALRWAGFGVAGLALAKVVVIDLATLDALYRVGSFLILGVVSLAVAYAYHRTGVRQ